MTHIMRPEGAPTLISLGYNKNCDDNDDDDDELLTNHINQPEEADVHDKPSKHPKAHHQVHFPGQYITNVTLVIWWS